MNTKYRYTLDQSSRKYHCPGCDKKEFVKYIDKLTGNYLPDQYGRCDRENNCGYLLDPYTDGYSKMIRDQEQSFKVEFMHRKTFTRPKAKQSAKMDPVFMPKEILKQTLKGYDKNVFIQNLCSSVPFPFEVRDIERVVELYRLGTVTSGYLNGATTFPYIDIKGNVRTIQVRLYDKDNHGAGGNFIHAMIEKHHTLKNEPLPDWLTAYNQNEKKVSCLFGEHLLSKYPNNPVAIAEGPKQAIYGTLYFGLPDNPTTPIWLATFNVNSLNAQICRPWTGRNVTLYPDLSIEGKAYHDWCEKAEEIQKSMSGTIIQVSDLLERLATDADRKAGKDLADYLIKHDWREYRIFQNTNGHNYQLSEKEGSQNDQDRVRPVENSTRRMEHQTHTLTAIGEQTRVQYGKTRSTQTRTSKAFINQFNELFIQNPIDPHRFTVYPNIESYNCRSVLPECKFKKDVDLGSLAPVELDAVSCQIVL